MDTLDIIVKARELISDPEHWVKGINRAAINRGDGPEYAYCALGAMREAVGHYNNPWTDDDFVNMAKVGTATDQLESDLKRMVTSFNDDSATTHGQVIRAFDTTIRRLEKEES